MKTLSLALVLTLLLVGSAGAVSTSALANESRSGACDNPIKDAMPCAIWVLRCVGDSLGGNACHSESAAESDPVDFVKCQVHGVQRTLKGQPAPYCYLDADAAAKSATAGSAGPDPDAVIACVGSFASSVIDGRPFEPCAVNAEADVDPKNVVECAKKNVRDALQGTPQPCPI